MKLFATQLSGRRLLLPAEQIRQVLGAPGPKGLVRAELGEALGIEARDAARGSSEAAEARILLCDAPGAGAVGFSLRQALVEIELGEGALVALPRVLRRVQPPSWLAGFARVEGGLAMVVDLNRLTHRILLSAPAPAAAS